LLYRKREMRSDNKIELQCRIELTGLKGRATVQIELTGLNDRQQNDRE